MDQEQQSRRRPIRRQLLWTGVVVGLLLLPVAILIGYRYGITLWDWINLLVVPGVIAGGGLWFNAQQREREQRIANERAQDKALQAYLDQMSALLIPPSKDLPSLYKARPGESLSSVARARTLTVLPRLDGDRKARVVQFLYEAGLISREGSVLDLTKANLRKANLSWASLPGANLYRTALTGADLTGADLTGANLRNIKGVTDEQLEQLVQRAWSVDGATMPDGRKYEDWLKDREGRGEDAENE